MILIKNDGNVRGWCEIQPRTVLSMQQAQTIQIALQKLGFRDLQIFEATAESGSFRTAASRLSVSQSSVSRRIQRIEDLVGVSLFERRTTGVYLTNAGRRFLKHSQRISCEAQAAIDLASAAGTGATGQLFIGLGASLSNGSIRSVYEKFQANHETVSVSFLEGRRGELLTQLNQRLIDAAFCPSSEVLGQMAA